MGGVVSTGRCFKKKSFRVMLGGPNGAGKTTTLHRLKHGEVVMTEPTIGLYLETIDFKGISLATWDLGGREKARNLFRFYHRNADVLIYIFDSANREKMAEEVKEDICSYAGDDESHHLPLAIVCNKQDLDGAMTVEEICKELDLGSVMSKMEIWKIFGVVATTGEGLDDLLQWVYDVTTSMENISKEKASENSKKQDQKSEVTKGWFTVPKSLKKVKNMFFEI